MNPVLKQEIKQYEIKLWRLKHVNTHMNRRNVVLFLIFVKLREIIRKQKRERIVENRSSFPCWESRLFFSSSSDVGMVRRAKGRVNVFFRNVCKHCEGNIWFYSYYYAALTT